MQILLLCVISLLSLPSSCLPNPMAANSLADIPLPENMTPNFILFSSPGHNESTQVNPTPPPKNITAPANTSNTLAEWPPVPFTIRIFNHIGARIRFYKTYNTGTPAQADLAQRLIAGEVAYLESHKATIGPKDLSVEADWTTIWLGCHAWVDKRSRWTNEMAIDTLKSLQEWIKTRGLQEGDFDVTDSDSWLANCQLLLHAPYPGHAGAIAVA